MNFLTAGVFILCFINIVGRARGFYCVKDLRNHNVTDDQERLMQDMLCDYDSYKRPVKDDRKIISVSLFFRPIFFEIMEQEEIFRIGGYFQENWVDDKLKWSPSKYGKLNEFKTSFYDIWYPKITSYDTGTAYRFIDEMDKHRFEDAIIKSNGTVTLRSISNLYGPCKSDTQAWPFEEWTCAFALAKTSDEEGMVVVKDFNPQVDLDTSVMRENKAWKIVSDPPFSLSNKYEGTLEISVTVQRYVSHFQKIFVFPGIALLTLTLISFWLTNRVYCRMILNMLTTLVQLTFLERMFTMLDDNGTQGVIIYDFFMDTMFTSLIGILFAVLNAKLITSSSNPPQYLIEVIGIMAVTPVIGPVFSCLVYEDMNSPSMVEDDEVGLVTGKDTKDSQKWRLISNFVDKCAFIVIALYFFSSYLIFLA